MRSASNLQSAPSGLAYRSRRAEEALNTGRGAERKQSRREAAGFNFWMQRFGLLVLLVAVVASAVNILRLTPHARVAFTGGQENQLFLRPAEDYQAAADRLLAASIWNGNKLTIDTDKLNQRLLNEFPELAGARATVPFLGHKPVIYLEPARPALKLAAGNGTYIVSNTGKALISEDKFQGMNTPNLPLLLDQSGLNVRLTRQALPAAQVSFVQTVTAQLSAKQLTVSGMTLPPSSNELDVQLEGQPYFIKFNLHSDNPTGQAGTFLAAINELKRRNIIPAKYVDVRVDGRAYYQ